MRNNIWSNLTKKSTWIDQALDLISILHKTQGIKEYCGDAISKTKGWKTLQDRDPVSLQVKYKGNKNKEKGRTHRLNET